MRCQDFQMHLLDQPQALTDSVHTAALAEHLAECADCKEFQLLWQELGIPNRSELPAGMTSRFQERLALELALQGPRRSFTTGWWFPLSVAALLLLALGMVLGYSLRSVNGKTDSSMARLRTGTAADRLEAIALVNARTPGQGDIVSALLERISNDPSVEVRLSAVEALYLFGVESGLSRRIEVALPSQTRPEVQLALIDLLGALRQQRAAEALRRLMNEAQLPSEARVRAGQRLAQMNL